MYKKGIYTKKYIHTRLDKMEPKTLDLFCIGQAMSYEWLSYEEQKHLAAVMRDSVCYMKDKCTTWKDKLEQRHREQAKAKMESRIAVEQQMARIPKVHTYKVDMDGNIV